MTVAEAVAILAAGGGAGAVNTVVGSGTLITFPILLTLGYAPVVANVSNTVGLVPGGFSGVLGYRRELAGQARRAARLGVLSVLGAITGAALLLTLPAAAFKAIVPVFIAVALLLVAFQPALARRLEARRRPAREGAVARAGILVAGVYGGYFGAAQGILLLGILGLALPDDLQRVNALKNVLATLVNLVAAAVFVLVADIAWDVAGLIAAGSVAGAAAGARLGRRLPEPALRAIVIAVGSVAIVRLLAG